MQFSTGLRSCRGGAFFKLLVFLFLLFGVIAAAWIFFMPMVLTSTLSKRTGFGVTVQRLVMNPFAASVDVEGLVVSNPYTFPRPDYVDVRNFQARAPLAAFFSDKPEFDFVSIDVGHMTFVRNTDGTLNAALFYDRLFPTGGADDDSARSGTRRSTKAGKPSEKTETKNSAEKLKMAFFIRRLQLKIDSVTVEDHFGRNPYTRDFKLGIDQYYLNVNNAKQLFTPAMIRSLSPAATTIAALIPGDLGKILAAAAAGSNGRDTGRKSGDPMKSIMDTLEESRKP